MNKICPRCGVIYNAATNEQKFCSTKCEKMFQQSSLAFIKKATPDRKVYALED
jgi:hypothetical protein